MVIADTGFWLALLNKDDRHHLRVVKVHGTLGEGYITTWPVLTETCHMLNRELGANAAVQFMDRAASDAFVIEESHKNNCAQMASMMKRYSNLPMDLADASLVLLAERLGHGRIVSTDQRDFKTYRWKNHKPFQNLLFPDD